jgi:ribosomal protein S18 acetylase RimI-like enzyme
MTDERNEVHPEGGDDICLRLGAAPDAAVAARLHVQLIAEGFLSRLGPRFLTRLYRRVAASGDSFLLMAERNGLTVGFLAGSTDLRALYRRFLFRDGLVAAWSAARVLLASWRRAIETLRHARGVPGTGTPERGRDHGEDPSAGDVAELLAIAVDPGSRRSGVGRVLVDGFLSEVRRRGAGRAQVVVGSHNRSAIALYEGAGFTRVEEFALHPGVRSLVMRWSPAAGPRPTDAGTHGSVGT